jgi:hypothetical protein
VIEGERRRLLVSANLNVDTLLTYPRKAALTYRTWPRALGGDRTHWVGGGVAAAGRGRATPVEGAVISVARFGRKAPGVRTIYVAP